MAYPQRSMLRPLCCGRILLRGAVGLWSIWLLAGCTGFQQVVPAPLVFEEQSKEILAIVPLGTPKTEAVQKLTEAGVSGEFASSPSIYYCDLWERENGNRWHMNVALLFNEQGELYQTRPAQSDVTWQSESEAAKSEKTVEQAPQ